MILWTMQNEEVYRLLQETGIYRCDLAKVPDVEDFQKEYDWLAAQMKRRIGSPPEGVTYPVWAMQKWYGVYKKPDLRRERWCFGSGGEIYYCLEVEIPDEQVLLTDFDAWMVILNDSLIADSEEEYEQLYERYNSLPPEEQEIMKYKNWERVFDLTPANTKWMRTGDDIQATFWELRKEQVREARRFVCGHTKK